MAGRPGNLARELTGRTRAAIRGFIKYLLTYEQGQQNKSNPEPVNL